MVMGSGALTGAAGAAGKAGELSEGMDPDSGASEALNESDASSDLGDAAKNKAKSELQKKAGKALKDKMGGKSDTAKKTVDDDAKSGGVDGDSKDKDKDDDGSDMKNLAKNAHRAVQAGQAAEKFLIIAKFMQFMQTIASMIASAVSSIVNGIAAFFQFIGQMIQAVVNFAVGVANAIVGGITAVGGWIAGAFGVSATAGTAAASSLAATIAGTVAVCAGFIGSSLTYTKVDGNLIDCNIAVNKAKADSKKKDVNAEMLNAAKHLYSVFHEMGLNNQQIAGILGNWQVESSLDSTSIEGVFGEHFNIDGPIHKEALSDLDAWTQKLFASYKISINREAYKCEGKYWCGLGLTQWTGPRACRLFRTADVVHMPWYALEYQIAYAVMEGAPNGIRPNFWNEYKDVSGDVIDCTNYFSLHFVGNGSGIAIDTRRKFAQEWEKQMGSWTSDSNYSKTVMDLAKKLGAAALNGKVAAAMSKCARAMDYDNSSLANAAVSYAWETQAQSHNDGTELYQKLHRAIFPGDPNFQSCDRSVAVAVRWSGTDITYPAGGCILQYEYALSSPKWKKVGVTDSMKLSDLQPGDIAIMDTRHTWMFVGNKAVKKKYPKSDGDTVSGSLGERSPGVGKDADYYFDNGGRDPWHSYDPYTIFRCSKPDKSDKYKGIV